MEQKTSRRRALACLPLALLGCGMAVVPPRLRTDKARNIVSEACRQFKKDTQFGAEVRQKHFTDLIGAVGQAFEALDGV